MYAMAWDAHSAYSVGHRWDLLETYSLDTGLVSDNDMVNAIRPRSL